MGELNVSVKDDGKPTRKKHSTRVDLTPMVDLGFLLITFFIFTTKMGEPKAMDLKLPKDTLKDSSLTAANRTLNLVLAADDHIWYYNGDAVDSMSKSDYANGIRRLIQHKKKVVEELTGKKNELVVLIKPTRNSSYKNLVDVLDEMIINNITRYVLMEPSAGDVAKVIQ